MRATRIGSLILAMIFTISMGLPASAQSAWEQLEQALMEADEAYQRAYLPAESQGSEPGNAPVLGAVILVMGSEEEAEDIYDLFIKMSEEDEYDIEPLDGLGDEAATIIEPAPGSDEKIIVSRAGLTLAIVVTDADSADPDMQEAVARHILETGPSEEEVVVDDQGIVTGGWADAFPEPDEVEGLDSFEASPVIQFGMAEAPEPATPAVIAAPEMSTPTQVSTPED